MTFFQTLQCASQLQINSFRFLKMLTLSMFLKKPYFAFFRSLPAQVFALVTVFTQLGLTADEPDSQLPKTPDALSSPVGNAGIPNRSENEVHPQAEIFQNLNSVFERYQRRSPAPPRKVGHWVRLFQRIDSDAWPTPFKWSISTDESRQFRDWVKKHLAMALAGSDGNPEQLEKAAAAFPAFIPDYNKSSLERLLDPKLGFVSVDLGTALTHYQVDAVVLASELNLKWLPRQRLTHRSAESVDAVMNAWLISPFLERATWLTSDELFQIYQNARNLVSEVMDTPLPRAGLFAHGVSRSRTVAKENGVESNIINTVAFTFNLNSSDEATNWLDTDPNETALEMSRLSHSLISPIDRLSFQMQSRATQIENAVKALSAVASALNPRSVRAHALVRNSAVSRPIQRYYHHMAIAHRGKTSGAPQSYEDQLNRELSVFVAIVSNPTAKRCAQAF